MARNLVKEKEEKQEEAPKQEPAPEPQKEEIRVVTFEEMIMNNLAAVIRAQEALYNTMKESFKQVGVKFPDEKQ